MWMLIYCGIVLVGCRCLVAADFIARDCERGDGLTRDVSSSVFRDTSSDFNPCRLISDLSLPRAVVYVINVDLQTVDDSTPGIVYNIQDDNNYDIILFRPEFYDCLRFGSFQDSLYTEHASRYCNHMKISAGAWFQVSVKVWSASVDVTIDKSTPVSYSTKLSQKPSAGLIHGLGYKASCSQNCEYNFRSMLLSPDTTPLIHNSEIGTLSTRFQRHNYLSVQRLELYHFQGDPGTYCFVAFYFEVINIGSATIYIQDDSDYEQGSVKIYSTSASNLDVYFYSTINPLTHGYEIHYNVFSCGVPDEDLSFICENGKYNNLHADYYRSTEYSVGDTKLSLSDNNLLNGWYRFSSCAGETMPTTSPEASNVCGTRDPIWLQPQGKGPKPNDLSEYKACLYKGQGLGCDVDEGWMVPVFDCNGDYMLYYLIPTPADSGYCAGHRKYCDPSQNLTSINGTGCSPCAEADFPVLKTPPTIGQWNSTDGRTYDLPCEIHSPTNNVVEIEYEVEWHIDFGTHRTLVKQIDLDRQTTVFLQYMFISKEYLQHNVLCRARGQYVGGMVIGPWSESEFRFLGLVTNVTEKVIDIGQSYALRFYFTVPINCDGNTCMDVNDEDCYTEVYSVTPTRGLTKTPCSNLLYREPILIHTSGCSVKVKCLDWGRSVDHRFMLTPKDTKQTGRPSHIHTLYVVTKDNRDMWNNLLTEAKITINVDVHANGKARAGCSSRTDPHVKSLKNTHYQVHEPGEYVLYQAQPKADENMNTLVTAEFVSCVRPEIMCNGAVGIRVNNEAIVIDPQKQPPYKYIGPGYGEDGFKLTVKNNMNIYKVYLPRGEIVTVTLTGKWINIVVNSPNEEQHGPTGNGLCGKIYSSGSIDLTYRDGKPYHKDPGRKTISEFSKDWRVIPGEHLINTNNITPKNKTHASNGYSCTVYDINEFLANDEWTFDQSLVIEPCIPHRSDNLMRTLRTGSTRDGRNRRRKRGTTSSLNPVLQKRNVKQWTNETAVGYCQSFIADSSAGSSCNIMNPDDVDTAVLECALDIMISGDTTWAESTLNSLREICITSLYTNLSLWTFEENGNETVFKPPPELSENLCSNDCSGHGSCVDGACVCDVEYIGFDCSVNIETPPHLHEIFDGDICYTEECDTVRVVGDDFVDGEMLTCHFNSDGGTTESVNGTMVSFDMVSCLLPTINTTHKGYTKYSLMVSNDGVHTGDALGVVVVNATCITCQRLDGTEVLCEVESTMCLVDGECVQDGEVSSTDVCRYCDPTRAQDNWTSHQGCGDTDTDSDNDIDIDVDTVSVSWRLTPLYIGLIAAACVIAVTLVVIVSVAMSNRSKKKKTYRCQ